MYIDGNSSVLVNLSEREFQVLRLLIQRKNNKQIAQELNVTVEKVRAHIESISSKLSVSSRTHAAVKALTDHCSEDDDDDEDDGSKENLE